MHVNLPLSQQVSNEGRMSMSESVSEFFDAQEVLLSASSSENEVSHMFSLPDWLNNHLFFISDVEIMVYRKDLQEAYFIYWRTMNPQLPKTYLPFFYSKMLVRFVD